MTLDFLPYTYIATLKRYVIASLSFGDVLDPFFENFHKNSKSSPMKNVKNFYSENTEKNTIFRADGGEV